MVNFCYFSRFSQNCEKRKLASLALSVCLLSVRLLAWNNSVPTGRIFIKYEICVSKFYQENRRFIKKMTSIMGTLHAELCTLITLYQWILLRTRNDLDKNCRENQKTYLVKYLFFSENRVVCEWLWKNTLRLDRPHATTQSMRFECCINYGYKHTIRILNTYCFSTVTVVTRTRHNVTLYVPFLSRYSIQPYIYQQAAICILQILP